MGMDNCVVSNRAKWLAGGFLSAFVLCIGLFGYLGMAEESMIREAGTASSPSGPGWTNPHLAAGHPGQCAETGAAQRRLQLSNFGFSIPSEATVLGIEVHVKAGGGAGGHGTWVNHAYDRDGFSGNPEASWGNPGNLAESEPLCGPQWQINQGGTLFDAWIQYDMGEAVARRVTHYELADCGIDSTRAPAAFKLQGSNDGVSWVDLDERSGVTWTEEVPQIFSVAPGRVSPYRYYRLLLLETVHASRTRLARVRLLEMGDSTSEAGRRLRAQLLGGPGPGTEMPWLAVPAGDCLSTAVQTLGGVDVLWGNAWTPAAINDPAFGVEITTETGGGSRVDWVEVIVYYTVSEGSCDVGFAGVLSFSEQALSTVQDPAYVGPVSTDVVGFYVHTGRAMSTVSLTFSPFTGPVKMLPTTLTYAFDGNVATTVGEEQTLIELMAAQGERSGWLYLTVERDGRADPAGTYEATVTLICTGL